LRYYLESTAQHEGLTFGDLLSLAEKEDARAVQALETMARHLGRGMRMIVAGMDPEQILMIGDLTRCWHRMGPIIEAEVRAQVLPGGAPPRLVPVHEGGLARQRGAIALVLQKHFGAVHDAAS
jgi:predicted NBD/HSP70 family sugar kinase